MGKYGTDDIRIGDKVELKNKGLIMASIYVAGKRDENVFEGLWYVTDSKGTRHSIDVPFTADAVIYRAKGVNH